MCKRHNLLMSQYASNPTKKKRPRPPTVWLEGLMTEGEDRDEEAQRRRGVAGGASERLPTLVNLLNTCP